MQPLFSSDILETAYDCMTVSISPASPLTCPYYLAVKDYRRTVSSYIYIA